MCGIAQDTGQLVAARALQGVGGALLTPGSLALIQSSFRPEDRARAIGLWSSLAGIAGLVGPFLGGVAGRRGELAACLPRQRASRRADRRVAGRHVPESRDPAAARPVRLARGGRSARWPSAGITYALIGAGRVAAARRRPRRRAVGVAAGSAFVVQERRTADPMLPPRLFADRQFSGANLATLVVYGALGGFSFFLVLQLQNVLGYEATAAGAAMLPTSLLLTLFSARAAHWPSGSAPASR